MIRRLRSASRRRVAAITAGGLALLLASTACSSGSGGSGSGRVNLTYAMWTTPEQAGYQKSIDVFERAHPNIHVTIESFAYNDYQPKLTTEFSSGGGPDIFWVNTPMIASWVQDGVMEDLTSKIRSAHIAMSQYIPTLVSLHDIKGATYGLPKDWDTIAYFYNADYFRQHHITIPANLSWNPGNGGSWLHFLKTLTYDTHGNNAASPTFDARSVATYATDSPNEMQWGFDPYLAENGVKIIDAPYAKHVAFDTAAGRQTFQFLSNLSNTDHVAVPGSALGTDAAANNNQDQQLFAQGKVAMIEGGDWETSGLLSEVKFHLGVLPFPSGPDGKAMILNGLIDSINTHSSNQQAAWELEQWLGSAASERILGSGGYVWPGIRSLDPLYAAYWQKQGVDVRPFLTESTWRTVTWPITPGMNQAQFDIANQLAPAYLSGGDVAASVSRAAKQANEDLDSAG